MNKPLCISWTPSWVNQEKLQQYVFKRAESTTDWSDGEQSWYCVRPQPNSWGEIVAGLREAAAIVRKMSISDIIDAIDAVAQLWCDRDWPVRIATREEVIRTTGFSREVVDQSFDVELKNYRSDSLWRVLRRELGNPKVLDGFCGDADLDGYTFGIGPSITLAIFTGNIPGLPALSIVRALLVKSAVIAKVASGEPTFGVRFVQSIFDVEPRLGNAIFVTYWERNDEENLSSVIAHADAVIAYGSVQACKAIRRSLRDDQIYVEHGHKISMGLLSRQYLYQHDYFDIAQRIAIDVSVFNQHACIAPQIYFIEADFDTARTLGSMIAKAMDSHNIKYPLGQLSDRAAATLQMQRIVSHWHGAGKEQYEQWQCTHPDWTVILDTELRHEGSSGNRYIKLIAVSSVESALGMMSTYASYLQNIALGVMSDELPSIARKVALLGASRICEPGRMSDPTMMWRHDGRMCIADMLRWCDIENYGDLVAPSITSLSIE